MGLTPTLIMALQAYLAIIHMPLLVWGLTCFWDRFCYTSFMDKETKQEFDDLGRMIKLGFDEVDKKFKQVDKRFEQVDKRFERLEDRTERGFANVNARLDIIEKDIAEIRRHFVYRDEFEDLMGRVKYLETKLGIESGK